MLLEEVKSWGPLILLMIAIASYYINFANRKMALIKQEEDHRKELERRFQEIRDLLDKRFNEVISKHEKEMETLKTCYNNQTTELMEQKTKISLFWEFIRTHIIDLMKTMPTERDRDILITKLVATPTTITHHEACELKESLLYELGQKSKSDKSIIGTYAIVIAAIDQVLSLL